MHPQCCERTKLISKVESKSQPAELIRYNGMSCERTKLISKVESKSQQREGAAALFPCCERTKLISKVESKSQLCIMYDRYLTAVKELS